MLLKYLNFKKLKYLFLNEKLSKIVQRILKYIFFKGINSNIVIYSFLAQLIFVYKLKKEI